MFVADNTLIVVQLFSSWTRNRWVCSPKREEPRRSSVVDYVMDTCGLSSGVDGVIWTSPRVQTLGSDDGVQLAGAFSRLSFNWSPANYTIGRFTHKVPGSRLIVHQALQVHHTYSYSHAYDEHLKDPSWFGRTAFLSRLYRFVFVLRFAHFTPQQFNYKLPESRPLLKAVTRLNLFGNWMKCDLCGDPWCREDSKGSG